MAEFFRAKVLLIVFALVKAMSAQPQLIFLKGCSISYDGFTDFTSFASPPAAPLDASSFGGVGFRAG